MTRRGSRSGLPPPLLVVAAAVMLAFAWWAVSLPPFSGLATAVVIGAGSAVALWGARAPALDRPTPQGGTTAPWAAVVLAGAAWEFAAYLQHPRDEHPTVSSLANALLDSQSARAAAFALWLLAMLRLSRR